MGGSMISSVASSSSAFSISLLPIILFALATVLVVCAVALRKKSAAKALQAAVAVLSALCILFSCGNMLNILRNTGGASANKPDSDEKLDLFRNLCISMAESLENMGKTDVKIKLADICDMEGKEAVCYYRDGKDHMVEIYALFGDMISSVYSKSGANGSLFLLNIDGLDYLLDYSQDISGNYTQSYSYALFRFNGSMQPEYKDQNSLVVEASAQGGGSKGSQFFSKLNEYLKNATICYDPYALKGESTMQGGNGENNVVGAEKYLYISNCSTSKIGVVTMKKDTSWLNLREGPARSYSPVLIDPYDPDSCVKQTQYSIVTIEIPENTNDPDYPVWYRMRITYANRTLEGWSAQTYINVEGIRKISVGSTFTVEAETNDSGVCWASSDSSVASIDVNTGKITAHRKGVVLITVGSDSGLDDSCLVMIE